MIGDLKPYTEYKESGLAWLGKVPSSWTTPRTKTRFRLSIEKSGKAHGKELLSVYTHIGVRPRKDLEQRGNKASSTDGYWVVRKGDIIVNKLLAWMGAVGVSHYDGVTSPAYDILRPVQQLDSDYYHQLFRTPLYLKLFKARSRGIIDMRLRLYFDQLGQIPLICPPPEEQAAIVRFLNWSNGQLDSAIKSKRKVIALLTEQKQAIIHRAVTKGLPSTGSGQVIPKVKMKDSGIPWLGEIPEHWDVYRLKRICRIQGGYAFPSSIFSDKGVPVVRMNNLHRGSLDLSDVVRIPESKCIPAFALQIDDILYGLSGSIGATGSLGNYAIVNKNDLPAMLNQRLARFIPNLDKIQPSFLVQLLQTNIFYEQVLSNTTGTAQFNVSTNDIDNVAIALPLRNEQNSIVSQIMKDIDPITAAISRLEREITLLREYRTRLVSDIVTGKLDVREAAAKLPEETAPAVVEDIDEPAEDVVSSDEEIAA